MRRILVILGLMTLFAFGKGQVVDNILVEQSGDVIKVHYKILDSTPDQIFRVSILCSINSGLKSQPNSLSGDFGENITGGRDEYMILWDVLKDVDEVNSAEFFIKAELIKDLSVIPVISDENLKSKMHGKFIVMLAAQLPGPKGGIRIGYSGNYGVSARLSRGKIPVIDRFSNIDNQDVSKSYSISLDLTKRIINTHSFQMHLIGGFINQDLYYYWPGPPSPVLWSEGEDGAEAGLLLSLERFAGSLIFSHFFAGKIENGSELDVSSPVNYATLCLGIRF